MTFTPGTYRRPLVLAVQLQEDSPWGEIATWCNGQLCGTDGDVRTWNISVPSFLTPNPRAYVGDWIVCDQGRWMIMCDLEFGETFLVEDPVDTLNRPRHLVPRQPSR